MIPKHLLIHDCTVLEKQGSNREGEDVFMSLQIKNVRLEVEAKSILENGIFKKIDVVTLFIDCKNSILNGWEPKLNDCILFEDKKYTINSIKKCCTSGRGNVHHYEARLV